KFTEHWSVATPVARRSLPSIGDSAVQWAGALSIVIVLVAAVIALPTLANLLRARGWSKIRRPVLRAALAVATVVVSTAGLAFWAHQLNYHQRNGGLFPYGIGVLITGLVALVALATVTSSVITVTRQLDFSRQTLRLLSSLALGLTTVMGVIVAGVALWWASEATFAPHVLESSIGSGIVLTSSALPPALVVAGVLMVLGLTSALVGSLRVLGGFKQT
ncbi:MAG TPA: hypothetical protein VNF05_06365, partial [Acidimicrobiales bacterium]|nr:hypothetical protein [Acidimicrobiales bacterium]